MSDTATVEVTVEPVPEKPKPANSHLTSAKKMAEYMDYEWRTGRLKSPDAKNIYAQLDPKPSKDDVIIGIMETPKLAAHVVEAHNGIFD